MYEVRHKVCLCLGQLDIRQSPLLTSTADRLQTDLMPILQVLDHQRQTAELHKSTRQSLYQEGK